jgi:hypothetical protein
MLCPYSSAAPPNSHCAREFCFYAGEHATDESYLNSNLKRSQHFSPPTEKKWIAIVVFCLFVNVNFMPIFRWGTAAGLSHNFNCTTALRQCRKNRGNLFYVLYLFYDNELNFADFSFFLFQFFSVCINHCNEKINWSWASSMRKAAEYLFKQWSRPHKAFWMNSNVISVGAIFVSVKSKNVCNSFFSCVYLRNG